MDPDHPSGAAHLWTLTSASASNIAGVRSRRAIVRAPSRAATNAAAVEDARAGAKPHPLKCSATISVESTNPRATVWSAQRRARAAHSLDFASDIHTGNQRRPFQRRMCRKSDEQNSEHRPSYSPRYSATRQFYWQRNDRLLLLRAVPCRVESESRTILWAHRFLQGSGSIQSQCSLGCETVVRPWQSRERGRQSYVACREHNTFRLTLLWRSPYYGDRHRRNQRCLSTKTYKKAEEKKVSSERCR